MNSRHPEHIQKVRNTFDRLIRLIRRNKEISDYAKIRSAYDALVNIIEGPEDISALNKVVSAMEISESAVKEIGLGMTSVISIFLLEVIKKKKADIAVIRDFYGKPVATITAGLNSVSTIGDKPLAPQAENLRNFLLNLAGDVRVILIKIAEQLHKMRSMKVLPQEEQIRIASEASYLYAPLAHRLGFYIIKLEMEDLSLEFTDRKI